MSNLARKIQTDTVYEVVGSVLRTQDGAFVVRADRRDVVARRAVSCLVEPEAHDEVVVSLLGDGRAYILAVLEREQGAASRLVFEGDASMEVRKGRFQVTASQGVSLTSGKDVNVTAGEVNVSALSGQVVLEKLSYIGTLIRTEVQSLKTFAATCDGVFERFSQRARHSFRQVQEIDQVKAKEIRYSAQDNLVLDAENAVVNAEELVKIDGGQVHLG